MLHKIFLLLICCIRIGASLQAQPVQDSTDRVIQNFMKNQHVPGFAACIVKGKSIHWSKAYGQADSRLNKAMSVDGIMNIGSISKTFTTAAAMQLWEKKKLDLDADINLYLGFNIRNPKYPDKPITVHQILTHTSSIHDGKAYAESYACGDPTESLNDWIRGSLTAEGATYYNGDNFADWSPGEKRQYSNIAFGLLGLIVEKISKQPFDQYCRRHIFQPLGMSHTGWYLRDVDTTRYIQPHVFVTEENYKQLLEISRIFKTIPGPGNYAQTCLYSFPTYPDGLVRTSVRDLSLFLAAMMNGGQAGRGRILKQETINKMLTLQHPDNDVQGLCWRIFKMKDMPQQSILWGHTGADPGIGTSLLFDPVAKIGIITFHNGEADGLMDVVKKLLQASE